MFDLKFLIVLGTLVFSAGGAWYQWGTHLEDYGITKAQVLLTACMDDCQQTCARVPPKYFNQCFEPCAEECKDKYLR